VTEQEWLTCIDPQPMMWYLGGYSGGGADKRKVRLFACACCRRLWANPPADIQEILTLAELHADKSLKNKTARRKLPAKSVGVRSISDRRKRAVLLAAFRHDDLDVLCEAVETTREFVAREVYDAHYEQLDPSVREVQRGVTGDEVRGELW
jgi:hypothetical protein